MKIKYETNGIYCINKCKHFPDIMVGSLKCFNCEYYENIHEYKKIVICKYKKNIFKTILNKLKGVK